MGGWPSSWWSWRGAVVAGAGCALMAIATFAWQGASRPTAEQAVADEAASARAPARTAANAVDGAVTRTVLVFVSGAVANPGTYRLPAGLRIADAIAAAGGLLPSADPDRMPNLSGRLTDGKQIKVARLSSRSASTSARLDINTAGVSELESIPGMDPSLAQAIVEYRDRYGGFLSLSELRTGLGLDAGVVSTLRRYLTVGN
jgi:competence protein ComEA